METLEGNKAVLSLGANLGNPAKSFREAVGALERHGLQGIRKSGIYQTRPVGCAPGTPDFSNAVVSGLWPGNAESLLELCKELETRAGRPPAHARYSSRALDIDIVFFSGLSRKSNFLTLPHPEAAKRFFVLVPVVEIEPGQIFPDSGRTAAEQLQALKAESDMDEMIIARKDF